MQMYLFGAVSKLQAEGSHLISRRLLCSHLGITVLLELPHLHTPTMVIPCVQAQPLQVMKAMLLAHLMMSKHDLTAVAEQVQHMTAMACCFMRTRPHLSGAGSKLRGEACHLVSRLAVCGGLGIPVLLQLLYLFADILLVDKLTAAEERRAENAILQSALRLAG